MIWLLLFACSKDEGTDSDTDPTPIVEGCRADMGNDDKTRAVVVSLPFGLNSYRDLWEVLDLSPQGELSRTGNTFDMGYATLGTTWFTPDGSLMIAALEDGTIGVVTFDENRVPTVVADHFGEESFYAGDVVIDPSGERAWVVDGNWVNNGGGITEITLNCETGEPTVVEKVLDSKLAEALLPLTDNRAVLVAKGAGPDEGGDAWMLHFGDEVTIGEKTTLFDYEDAIYGSAALTPDEKYVLVGDNSAFSGTDNHVAIASIEGDDLNPIQDFVVEDPISLQVSPFNDAAIVASGFGDSLYSFSYDPAAALPFGPISEIDYVGAHVALPAGMVMLSRGSQTGMVFVAENIAVRQLQFEGNGEVTDLGPFVLDDIPGVIGIQP